MFGKSCALIGAVHLPPLPGAAGYGGSMAEIAETALFDAGKYKECGFDALIIENTHDIPYLKGFVYPETVAAMTVISNVLKNETGLPVGVQVLAGANTEALAIAVATGLDFIRVEGFVFAHIGDEGIHQSSAAELIRKRFDLSASKVKIIADVKKKHSSHAITDDVSLGETAEAAQLFKADGIVVSGTKTGAAPNVEEVQEVREKVHIPVILGSGVNPQNIRLFRDYCDALIIGTYAKADGNWEKTVDPERCQQLLEAFNK